MIFNKYIKQIRRYSLIAFVLPLVAINSCFLLYQFFGATDIYLDINYPNKKNVTYSLNEYDLLVRNKSVNLDNQGKTFRNCPKYNYNITYKNSDGVVFRKLYSKNFMLESAELKNIDGSSLPGQVNTKKYRTEILKKYKINQIVLEPIINEPNNRCIKNRKISYFFINNFTFLDKILSNTSENYSSGFSVIKNPYIYGEVSISRTARYFPANLIFKPLILISVLYLFFYWKNTFNLLNELRNKNILKKFSSRFYFFGILSCIFLAAHAIFLGVEFDSKLFTFFRRVIIILFIFCEIIAQFILTKNLFTNKKKLLSYVQPIILNIKIIFVAVVLLFTLILFVLLSFVDLESHINHILEWNYFSVLLIYYFLSRMMWKVRKL